MDAEERNEIHVLLKDHERSISDRFDAHEKFVEKRLDWQDTQSLALERRMGTLERATNHKVDNLQEIVGLLNVKIDRQGEQILQNHPYRYLQLIWGQKFVQAGVGSVSIAMFGLLVANGKMERLWNNVIGFFN